MNPHHKYCRLSPIVSAQPGTALSQAELCPGECRFKKDRTALTTILATLLLGVQMKLINEKIK